MSEEHANTDVRQMVREIRAAVIPMVDNIHKDVHGVRREFRDAIEKSQTALLDKLSVIQAKVDRLVPSGDVVTEQDKALMAASLARMETVIAQAKALDEMTPA